MNKRQKEVQRSLLNNETEFIKRLKAIYEKASKDCEDKISQLSARTDMENLQSIIYQKRYQEILKKQIDEALLNIQSNEYSSISDYLENSYTNGFMGTLYDLHGQGVPLIFPIDQRQVTQAVQLDSKISNSLYTRMGEDVEKLKRDISSEVSRGIANGSTWNQTAVNIAFGMNSPFKKAYNSAIRITRTEGHRIQNQAQMDTIKTAKSKGADVVKQWDSTLDGRTRDSHRRLDGQIREIDEPFEIGGLSAMCPGDFGDPAEDCNCRCCMIQRAKWALDESELKELKDRTAYFGLDKTDDFEEFKNKYLKAVENSGDSGIIEAEKCRQFSSGDEVNEFFYYDGEERGIFAKRNSQHGQWKRSLSEEQIKNIREYTADGYSDINNYWRKHGDWENINHDKVILQTQNIDKAISEYELKAPIKVYRAIQPEAFEQYRDDMQRLVGTEYSDPAFMSTSPTADSSAVNKKCIMELFIPAGKGRGAYINDLSIFQDEEYEFLLARNSRFTVSSVEETEQNVILKMELITND